MDIEETNVGESMRNRRQSIERNAVDALMMPILPSAAPFKRGQFDLCDRPCKLSGECRTTAIVPDRNDTSVNSWKGLGSG